MTDFIYSSRLANLAVESFMDLTVELKKLTKTSPFQAETERLIFRLAREGEGARADEVPDAVLGEPTDVELQQELVAKEAAEAVHHDGVERRRFGGGGVDHALELRPPISEGFDIPDLKEAKRLLDELA